MFRGFVCVHLDEDSFFTVMDSIPSKAAHTARDRSLRQPPETNQRNTTNIIHLGQGVHDRTWF